MKISAEEFEMRRVALEQATGYVFYTPERHAHSVDDVLKTADRFFNFLTNR